MPIVLSLDHSDDEEENGSGRLLASVTITTSKPSSCETSGLLPGERVIF